MKIHTIIDTTKQYHGKAYFPKFKIPVGGLSGDILENIFGGREAKLNLFNKHLNRNET